eukprot:12278-Heterococcus_DN1.PRE.5
MCIAHVDHREQRRVGQKEHAITLAVIASANSAQFTLYSMSAQVDAACGTKCATTVNMHTAMQACVAA